MKCVCPMGGDRTCPDDCLIAVWHSLPPDQRTKERRRPLVKTLAEQGYTQDAIAGQIGISQQTVGRDLETLSIVDNVKGQGKDTRGRKKSTGRKRGGTKPQLKERNEKIVALADKGLPTKEIAAEVGIVPRAVSQIIEHEQIRREAQAEPIIERAALSMTAQQKLDAAIKQHKAKLDEQFHQRVHDRIQERIKEFWLPHYQKQLDDAQTVLKSRKGIMPRAMFRKILACLHPEYRDTVGKDMLTEVFNFFKDKELVLCSEKELPSSTHRLPSTPAEWDALKAKAAADRKAKRNGKSNAGVST